MQFNTLRFKIPSLYQTGDKRKDVAPVKLQRLPSTFNLKRNNETFLMKSTKWGEIGLGPPLHFSSMTH